MFDWTEEEKAAILELHKQWKAKPTVSPIVNFELKKMAKNMPRPGKQKSEIAKLFEEE